MAENQTPNCCDNAGNDQKCCCRADSLPGKPAPFRWITGFWETPIGLVPQVSTRLGWQDRLGAWKARWAVGRMNYRITPGLYAVGVPDKSSVVLVSANYKMSFDRLRQELNGINAWIMVIDTKGINVWCAAGKGTFGTAEIVRRVAQVRLAEVVDHRKLILPQLGAPGVSAHEVKRLSGFQVVYGPVRAVDLSAFLQAGQKAIPEMRTVNFGFWDRLVLAPVELSGVIKPALIGLAVLFLMQLPGNHNAPFLQLIVATLIGFIPYLGAILAGTVFVPALLPWIPGRSFAWKGWLFGLLWTAVYIWLSIPLISWGGAMTYFLLLPAISSFLAMGFTGSSTYTSLSGVVKEMGIALLAVITSAGLGMVFLIVQLFVSF
jgi:hypothetical protein